MLSRASIIAAKDLPTNELVSIPEWGGDAYIAALGGIQRLAVYKHLRDLGQDSYFPAICLCHTLVDDTGKRLFDDGDYLAIAHKSAEVIERLFKVTNRLNRFLTDDAEKKG